MKTRTETLKILFKGYENILKNVGNKCGRVKIIIDNTDILQGIPKLKIK